jgi:FMN phosphatase YigB (HAD superfamily)
MSLPLAEPWKAGARCDRAGLSPSNIPSIPENTTPGLRAYPRSQPNQIMPPKPSIIVFDLGKVLVDFDYSIAARRLGTASGMSLDQLQNYLSQSDLLVRYETGLISRAEFYSEVCQTTGYTGTIAEFGMHFANIFTEIPTMIELHSALRSRGFPTYIFSNTNDLAVADIRAKFPFFSQFDGYIFSYEVRAMKPAPRIYEALELLAGKRGSDLLYIDDRRENIAAGAARGWQTILQETPSKTLAAVQELGLLT